MRIIHLSSDEKFIDQAIRQFEEILPGQNHPVVITKRWSLRHVKHPSALKVSAFMAARGYLRDTLREADLVVLHSLTPVLWQACRWMSEGKPLLWLGFGFDYYDLINAEGETNTGPLTTEFAATRRSGPRKWIHDWKQRRWFAVRREALHRITHFAPVLPTEYQMILKRTPDFAPRFASWSYSSVEDAFGDLKPTLAPDANDILVGNSAAISNNHLETIEMLLGNRFWSARQLVMPLSYGSRDYRTAVLARGRELGAQFLPLTDFVPVKEYIGILSRCRTAILNHMRQQAVGNIMILLHQGSAVFIHEESPVFTLLRDEGAVIFSLAELARNPEMIDVRLTPIQVEYNRMTIGRIWGRQAVQSRTRSLLGDILAGASADGAS